MADILSQEEIDKLLSTVVISEEEEAGLAQFGELSVIALNAIAPAINAYMIEQNWPDREFLLIGFMEDSEKGIIISTTAKLIEEEEELEIGLIFKTQDNTNLLLDIVKQYFAALKLVISVKMHKWFSFDIDKLEAKELCYNVDDDNSEGCAFHTDGYICFDLAADIEGLELQIRLYMDDKFRSLLAINPMSSPAHKIPQKISVYDFRRPDRVTKEQLRSLYNLHSNFARSLSASLSSYLQRIANVSLVSVDQMTYGEFLMSLPDPTSFNILNVLSGNAILEINPSISFSMIDNLAGGAGLPLFHVRGLTQLEKVIFNDVIQLVLQDLNNTWAKVDTNIRFQKELSENSPHTVQIVAQNETVVLLAFEVKFGEVGGMMTLCLPALVLEPILGRISSQGALIGAKKGSGKTALQKNMEAAPVAVHIELERLLVTLRELASLKEGDIFAISKKPFLFCANEQPIFSCEINDLMNANFHVNIKDKYVQSKEINMATDEDKLSESLLNMEMTVSARLGKTQMTLKQVYGIEAGSIIGLDRSPEELVELIAGNKLIARGEVVVVDGNLAIRVKEVAGS
jgi:flagellar motor switch protein FliM